jgi:hypothetical protein
MMCLLMRLEWNATKRQISRPGAGSSVLPCRLFLDAGQYVGCGRDEFYSCFRRNRGRDVFYEIGIEQSIRIVFG